jgi:outer membrane cobalamin receptor
VDGRVVQSSARDLLELLQRYPIVQRMFEAALEGRSPLVVVDGVALVSPYRLADIRLIEVERVLLLRGAQAMMQYGARAAEGAIIVETRIRSPEPPPFSRGASGPGVSAGRTGR